MLTPSYNQTEKKSFNLAEISISYKSLIPTWKREKIESSGKCNDILKSIWSDDIDYIEEFIVLFLNRANQVLGWKKVSQGGAAGTAVDVKVIYGAAILAHASQIIIAHNHPSGNLKPSEPDLRITNKIKEAGTFLDIKLLDHLILTQEGYYSFADNGEL